MACRTLLRRRTQLALLASACQQGARACINLRRRGHATGEVRLESLEHDGVLLVWAGCRIQGAELPGQPVDVHFEHQGERYAFSAITRQHADCTNKCAARGLLKLSLPLRLERADRRRQLRVELNGLPPIVARFTHVVDDRRQFEAQLTNIAERGIAVTAQSADVARLHTGDLFWVDIELPGEASRSEFVVRLAHLRPIKHTDKLAMGWAFQPADDPTSCEKYLRRVEAFVARRQGAGNAGRKS
jgi:hypothetical protein